MPDHRQVGSPPTAAPTSGWEKATTLSSIFVSVTVPFLILALGWRYTASLESESVRKDLVGISVEILAEPIPEARYVTRGESDHAVAESEIERDRYLRDWAVDILEEASTVPIEDDMAEALRGPQVQLPSAAPAGPAASTDGDGGGASDTAPEEPQPNDPIPGDDQSSSEPPGPATDVTTNTTPTNTTPVNTSATRVTIDNWFGQPRADAVTALRNQGFQVNDFEVCSGSVAAGEVRQILNGNETVVYVDIAGTTAAGRSVPVGSMVAVKVGNGSPC